MENIKLLLKISTPTRKEPHWVHMCYIPRELHKEYTEKFHQISNLSLSRWCKEDFGVEMDIKTSEDLDRLKSLVKGYYGQKYPEIYYESNTDHQGWFRIWVTNKMKEELCGKACI